MKKIVLSALFSAMVYSSLSAAPLKGIRIIGNKRIESETVHSYIPIKVGEEFASEKMNETLKALFATGYFADVKVDHEGDTLVIHVEENPIINRIAYEGNDKLKDDVIQQEIKLRAREVLTHSRIQEAQQRLLEIYRRMGRFGAKVEPKIIKLPESRVDLVFEINEGGVTYIRKITFVGNKHFPAKKLEEQLNSKRTRWYRFFAVDDVYDPDRFIADQQALRKFYYDNGYPDFRIVTSHAELSPDQKDFFLTFHVEEGERYEIGKIDITSKLPNVNTDELKKSLTFAEGDMFSGREFERSILVMSNMIGMQGYAFVAIEPIVKKHPETKKADVTFEIKEGPRVYIEKIVFVGNDRTRDHVLRREMELHEGDAYNSEKLKMSERRLKDLGYFKTVTVDTEPGAAHDQARVIVKVEEQRTGEIGLAGGFSTLDGPLASVKLTERNFMGTGRTLFSDLSVAKKRQDFNVGVIEPYFLGRNMVGNMSVFGMRSGRSALYEQKAIGTNLGVGYRLSTFWSQSFNYKISHEKISHSRVAVSPYVSEQMGTSLTSAVTHSIAYDRRDSVRNPTTGYVANMSNTYAGLGGNVEYLRNSVGAGWFHPLMDEVVLNVNGEVGAMTKLRRKIRLADRFSLGLESFRGFEYGGLGPRDAATGDSLNGTRFWTSTTQVVFPLGLPTEFGIKGAVFTDLGSVWRVGESIPGTTVLDSNRMRASVGCGISWDSPFGPISIDYARAVKREKYDRTQSVIFGFSSRF